VSQVIPVFNNLADNEGLTDWTETISLDGVSYRLRIWWSDRVQAWYADLYAADGSELWKGSKLQLNWPLFSRLRGDGAPAGTLFVASTSTDDSEPVAAITRTNLGTDAVLLYLTGDELDAIEAAAAAGEPGISIAIT